MALLSAVTHCAPLVAGSLRPSQRAAAAMSLIQSARMNGRDPYVYRAYAGER